MCMTFNREILQYRDKRIITLFEKIDHIYRSNSYVLETREFHLKQQSRYCGNKDEDHYCHNNHWNPKTCSNLAQNKVQMLKLQLLNTIVKPSSSSSMNRKRGCHIQDHKIIPVKIQFQMIRTKSKIHILQRRNVANVVAPTFCNKILLQNIMNI